ncbi:MAG: DNA methyltransferase [Limosilactobacillus pontis]|uniref:Site-specific DNA-methyltransferase n=1 Tax=Limosilactobacillus pontis TaxID=35787 RepID=A0A2J6NN49_9LACO|nr:MULTISPECIES: site-specific DNA-methyltransferase [Limosilactobacillus]PMB82735.1 site-specific DNA-methyltransferase [Limosilactobacillus pontis]WCT58370.1 DNA methyltransferase [Limosilactobacillus vaginalis]
MQTDNERYNETVQPNTAFLNELKEKLPEFFTKDGSFDLDKFKDQLKDKNVNELSEGYQLDFIGKDYARRQAGEMPSTVIVPDEKQNQGEGKDSKNLFFTGDNLEVLRHLQNNYQNRIDVIYIDPPYNTGSDGFVYPDSFEYSDDKLKDMFGLDDDQVERLKSIQGKSSHSAWLTFMYPRLVLAKRLLNDNGVIFISIDSNEQATLREIQEEIFGENQFIAEIVRNTNSSKNNSLFISTSHDYCLVYGKDRQSLEKKYAERKWSVYKNNISEYLKRVKDLQNSGLTNNEISDELKQLTKYPRFIDFTNYWYIDKRGLYRKDNIGGVKNGNMEPLYNPITKKNDPVPPNGYRYSPEKLKELVKEDRIHFHTDGSLPAVKRYLNENLKQRPKAIMSDDQRPDDKLLKSFKTPFSNPKQLAFITRILSIFPSDATFLDFFAGSATTAHAVMSLNAQDNGKRKFIMVQLPEKTYHTNKDGNEVPTDGGKEAYKLGYKSIDEISRRRINMAAKKIREDNELTLPKDFDGSFKHYRVVKPVKQTLEEIDDFDPNNTNLFTNMVDGFSSKSLGIDGDATGEETILTTWLAKDGYSFDADVEEVKFGNYSAHKVEDNRLYLINEGWRADQTKELLNQLGTCQLEIQSVVIFGYSFNVAELRELENGLKQLDSKVTLIKRY